MQAEAQQETQQELELEIIEDTPEKEEPVAQETQAEAEKTQEQPKEAIVENESDEKDELENYSEGVQKRISKLTAKMREAERREKAALDYAQSVKKELEEQNQKTQKLDTTFVNEFENRIKYQDQMLKQQLKDAIDRGDVDAQVEAQKNLAQLAQDNERLSYVKQQKEEQNVSKEEKVKEPPVAQAQEPHPKAKAWADKNTWFGVDEPMTLTAFSFHKRMIEQEGYDGTSDEYYEELDKRIRNEFPHKFQQKANGRSAPPVGGANRGNQRGGQQKVKLTQSEVAIARKLGISNEQYAKQKLRLQS
tara:strand:+ start:108 stop:1022 length:915 start_codon:yes stop_codon:yes gene_type:complete